jgi:hypothetical protein
LRFWPVRRSFFSSSENAAGMQRDVESD